MPWWRRDFKVRPRMGLDQLLLTLDAFSGAKRPVAVPRSCLKRIECVSFMEPLVLRTRAANTMRPPPSPSHFPKSIPQMVCVRTFCYLVISFMGLTAPGRKRVPVPKSANLSTIKASPPTSPNGTPKSITDVWKRQPFGAVNGTRITGRAQREGVLRGCR